MAAASPNHDSRAYNFKLGAKALLATAPHQNGVTPNVDLRFELLVEKGQVLRAELKFDNLVRRCVERYPLERT